MITGTFNADTFRRALLAVLHAAHRDDVKHNKHKCVYFLHEAGRLFIFALNGKRLASVSFAAPGAVGECMALSPDTCADLITKTQDGADVLLCDVGGQLLIYCGTSTLFVTPDGERFTFEQYEKSLKVEPIDAAPVTLCAQYLEDVARSCRALGVDTIALSIRGAGNATLFRTRDPRFDFMFVCMAQREGV